MLLSELLFIFSAAEVQGHGENKLPRVVIVAIGRLNSGAYREVVNWGE